MRCKSNTTPRTRRAGFSLRRGVAVSHAQHTAALAAIGLRPEADERGWELGEGTGLWPTDKGGPSSHPRPAPARWCTPNTRTHARTRVCTLPVRIHARPHMNDHAH
jgi:hypothetical protein